MKVNKYKIPGVGRFTIKLPIAGECLSVIEEYINVLEPNHPQNFEIREFICANGEEDFLLKPNEEVNYIGSFKFLEYDWHVFEVYKIP